MQTQRQKEIIEAALELIAGKGIQNFTMKNLSKKIGISEPAIYRHFENKIQILIAIMDQLIRNTGTIFENELSQDISSIDKLEHIFSRHFETFSNTPALVSVIFSEEIFRNEPKLIEKAMEVMDKNDTIITNIIISGQKNNVIRTDAEAKHLSIMVMGILRLFVKKWQFSSYSFSLQEEGKKLFESIRLLILR